MDKLIGRDKEHAELERCLNSDRSELVIVYGRRRCANNLNQVAVHANTYGIYPSEIAALQKDYADLWEPLSELLKKLSAVVSL